MFRKLSAMVIVAVMLFVSISMVSFNVSSEGVPGPFADRSTNYPQPTELLDQQQLDTITPYTLTSTDWARQAFRPGMDGELTKVSLFLERLGGTGNLGIEIWNTDQSGLHTSFITAEFISEVSIPVAPNWLDIEITAAPKLVAGTEYAFIIYATDSLNVREYYRISEPYPQGTAWMSATAGIGWSSLSSNGDYSFKTHMTTGIDGLKKVAWHPDGKYALAVAGDDTVYRYDREITTWSVEGTPNADYVLNDIVWDSFYNEFYLVGENVPMGRATAYKYDGTTFTDLGNTPSLSKFYAVDVCGGYGDYNFLAVGEDSGGFGYAAWHHDTLGWVEVSSGWTPGFPEQLQDVTWNQRDTAATCHYAVGVDDESDGFVYRFSTGSTVATMLYEQDSWTNELEPGYAISWNPLYSMGASYDYALIGTEQYYGYGNCYKFDGLSSPSLISKATYPIYDIGWHPDGELAVLVGGNIADGKVYHHNRGINAIVDMTGQIPGSPDIFYGVAVKGPTSPSSAIIIGPSGSLGNYVDASDTGTQLTVNAAFPNIFWIGFNDTLHNSKIEQQVTPDEWYEFSFAANYSFGWANCEVIVQAWYDNGNAGDASIYPAENEINRCLAFSLIYDPDGGPFYSMTYPGIPEYAVGGANDVIVPGGTPGEEIHYVTLGVRLGPQIRNADGNSFGIGDSDTDPLKSNALQDINSWDFNITVRDAASTDAFKSMYSEFGIEKAVSVSVSGNPSGSAPPGSSDVLLSNPSQITYSSNANYWVNVSVPDLLENGVGPADITADYVAVANTNVFVIPAFTEIDAADYPNGRAFTGANQDWCVWGNRSQGQSFMSAPRNGSVSFGPYGSDYNAAWTNGGASYTELNWWITVPGSTSEGIYWATITITIESEG